MLQYTNTNVLAKLYSVTTFVIALISFTSVLSLNIHHYGDNGTVRSFFQTIRFSSETYISIYFSLCHYLYKKYFLQLLEKSSW